MSLHASDKEEEMSNAISEADRSASAALPPSYGREHAERRVAQAAAARKPRLKSKHDYDWKKEEQ